jgi:hypothetical protein
VVRWWHVAIGLAVVAGACALAVRGLRTPRGERVDAAVAEPPEAAVPGAAAPWSPAPAAALAAMPRRTVTLYWPDSKSGMLAERQAEIFATASRVDQAKQVVGLLLAGPAGAAPDRDGRGGDRRGGEGGDGGDGGGEGGDRPGDEGGDGGDSGGGDDGRDGDRRGDEGGDDGARGVASGTLRAPLPAGTALRHVFVDRWGVAHVSLTQAARTAAPGGTDWERLAVGSLANSLVRSLPEVRGVRLLVEGQEVDTLTGHLDLTRPIAFDDRLVAAAAR